MKNYILSIALVLPAILFGQLDRSVRPTAAKAPVINIKDSEVFKLKNGLTVILSENHKLPKVTFNLAVGAKPRLEGNQSGLSELAGSLIMSGTLKKSKDELDREVDYIGARLSADNNSIYLSCLTKHIDKGLTLMSDILMSANFPQSEVDRIIKQHESSLLSLQSDADGMAKNSQAIANFPGHPFGEIMTESTLANINRESIVNYYKKTFVPEGAYLVIVGDITKEEARYNALKYFGSWSGSKATQADFAPISFANGNRVLFVKKPGAVQSVIKITYPMDISPNNEDYLKLKVLNGVLGGGAFGNRLMQNLREDKAYTYGCRSGVRVSEHGSWFVAGGNFRNEVTDSAIYEILSELKKITTELVTDEEINLTKSAMAGSFARSLEQPSTIASFALSIIKNDLPADYYKTYLQKLEAVSKEDLLEVAKKYFTAENCNIIVVGNQEIADKLLVFDNDGKIEKLDAFGNEVKDILPADISKEELIAGYINAISMTSSKKALDKKMKKVTSMQQDIELTMEQIPFPLKSTEIWVSPNIQGKKMEGQGMIFQRSFFDGTAGYSVNMQTGKKEMTENEIKAKQLSYGLIPEINYATNGIKYELLGIEMKDGHSVYVLKIEDGTSETYDYFDKKTFYKIGSLSITTVEDETQETQETYSDYEENDGFMFPMTFSLSAGGANFTGKVTSITLNTKVDLSLFK
ncbi:MAG: insulinase family protein [Crocinitomicaceae bacterium]|nr:insulinase family protein [Crocinitomicaceae bacterium]MDG1777041.1 insulinase family protein [Crocinitomicaceae bacterium]